MNLVSFLSAFWVVSVVTGLGTATGSLAADQMSAQDIIQRLKPNGATRNLVLQDQPAEPARNPPMAPPAQPVNNPAQAEVAAVSPPPAQPALSLVIQFRINSHLVLPAGLAQLQALAVALKSPELQGLLFHVEGHTDKTGVDDVNLRLSQKRANEVVQHLVRLGVGPGRLSASGHGSAHLLPGVPPGAAQHRRVVVRGVS